MSTPITEGVHHLGLTVSDLSVSRDFFVEALGFKLLGQDTDYPAVFVSDDITIITLWLADQNHNDFDRKLNIGLHHVAFKVSSMDALTQLYFNLSRWPGVELEGSIKKTEEKLEKNYFFIRMPGGPRLEFRFPN